MIIFYKKINGIIEWVGVGATIDDTYTKIEISQSQVQMIHKYPIIDIQEDNIVFDFSIEEKIKVEELKTTYIQATKTLATAIRAEVAGNADFYEVGGWTSKKLLAERFFGGTASEQEIGLLAYECKVRGKGETPQQLATKIMHNASQYQVAIATIDGMVKTALDAFIVAESIEELETIKSTLEQKKDGLLASLRQKIETPPVEEQEVVEEQEISNAL